MSIHTKILRLALVEATWIAWVLSGFSVGGLAVVIERLVNLARASERIRTLTAFIRPRQHRVPTRNLALSSGW